MKSYYTPSMQIVKGDAIVISGDAKGKCIDDCSFFESETMTFILSDNQGNQYEMQAPIVEFYEDNGGTLIKFAVYFSLQNGDYSASLNRNWGDIIIEDYSESNRRLPGHKVNLSPFNNIV